MDKDKITDVLINKSKTAEFNLDDFLMVLSKCKLIPVKINFTNIQDNDAKVLQILLQNHALEDISLKTLVLEKSKQSSQSLEEILELLNVEKIEQIKKEDLLTNLIHAYLVTHKLSFSVYDIATIILQYMSIQRFITVNKNKSSNTTLEFVDFYTENGSININLKDIIINEFEGLLHESKLNHIKLSNYSQLNKIIFITSGYWSYFPEILSRLGAAFFSSKNDLQKICIIPFGVMLQICQQLSDVNCKRILPAPVIGCFDFAVSVDFMFNKQHRYRPLTIPSYLSAVKKLFYGVDSGEYNPTYNNINGFTDMTIAHDQVCGYLGVYMHDLFHLSYHINSAKFIGVMGVEEELYCAMQNMLKDKRFESDYALIKKTLIGLIDAEFIFDSNSIDISDPVNYVKLLQSMRSLEEGKFNDSAVETNLHTLASIPDTETLSFSYYRKTLAMIEESKANKIKPSV